MFDCQGCFPIPPSPANFPPHPPPPQIPPPPAGGHLRGAAQRGAGGRGFADARGGVPLRRAAGGALRPPRPGPRGAVLSARRLGLGPAEWVLVVCGFSKGT